MTRRPIIGVGAVAIAVALVATIALANPFGSTSVPSASSGASGPVAGSSSGSGGATGGGTGGSGASGDPGPDDLPTGPAPTHQTRPEPGHEVFGYLPYWEMFSGIERYVATVDLTTLALFSVTNTSSGAIDRSQLGYKRINGDVGKTLIRVAHQNGMKVQLVYTSINASKNAKLFASVPLQDKVIASLVPFALSLGVDGINVDVERLDISFAQEYGAFVGRLRDALRARQPSARVSIATTSGPKGAAMAKAASDAGADRIFIMAYDYHYAASEPGASAPMDRRDGQDPDLQWTLDTFDFAGVPLAKTILGLPLYGMRWRVTNGQIGAPAEGNGAIWLPMQNVGFLQNPPVQAMRDDIEIVDVYALPPPAGTKPTPTPKDPTTIVGHSGWQAIYVDSPATLTPKLQLADQHGLAGAGFFALGYERGLPAYDALINRFAAGQLD